MSNITVKEAAAILAGAKNILLVCHVRPDGDTLGSAFGLKHAMETKGHMVKAVCGETIPERLKFISDGENELTLEGFTPELICSVDAAETSLTGKHGELEFDLKLDHHGSGTPYAKHNYIDGSRAACAEIIFDIIRELEALGHAKLTPESATALYAAISSDTGCFKYSNVTSATMRIAADLIDAGADYENVCRRLFETRSISETTAQKLALNNVRFIRGNSIAIITYTNCMKSENGLSDDDLGGIGSYLRETEGVELSVVIKQSEAEPRKYRISMRSGAEINASDLCSHFGGGGHARAAGGNVIADSPAEAEKKVIEALLSVIGENN